MKLDEFALVMLAGVILIAMLMVVWTTPTEAIPVVDPSSVSLALQNGTSGSFIFSVKGTLTNVTLNPSGSIASWLHFDKTRFDVGDRATVTVSIDVPNSTANGTYRGKVNVKSTGGETSLDVSIEVSTAKRLTARAISLGDFEVSFISGSRVVKSLDDAVVSKSYFDGRSVDLSGALTIDELSTVKDASISFSVSDTNNYGNLIVVFNGEEVLNKQAGRGDVVISIEKEKLKRNNEIIVRSGSPGFYFWANTVYVLKNVKFTAVFKGAFEKAIDFTLDDNEVNNFDHFQLTFAVRDYSTPLQTLSVDINGQTVFNDNPPTVLFNANFDRDILDNGLLLKQNNTIAFSFSKQASIAMKNALLKVFSRSVQ